MQMALAGLIFIVVAVAWAVLKFVQPVPLTIAESKRQAWGHRD